MMWGWEGLYGRPRGGGVLVFLQNVSAMNSTRATDVDGLVLRLMPIGRSAWPSPRAARWSRLITLGSTLAALSSSSLMLALSRALQGVGAVCITPLTLTILTRTFPEK